MSSGCECRALLLTAHRITATDRNCCRRGLGDPGTNKMTLTHVCTSPTRASTHCLAEPDGLSNVVLTHTFPN